MEKALCLAMATLILAPAGWGIVAIYTSGERVVAENLCLTVLLLAVVVVLGYVSLTIWRDDR